MRSALLLAVTVGLISVAGRIIERLVTFLPEHDPGSRPPVRAAIEH